MRRLYFCGSALLLVTVVLGACSSSDGSKSPAGIASQDGGPRSTSSDATTTPPVTTTPNATTTAESVTINGVSRVYFLSIPNGIDKTKPYPLVMELHGSPGSAAIQATDQFDLASGKDAIVVYPQALNQDNGAFSWDLASAAPNNADIGLIEALPGELKAKGLNIDLRKVFGYGYSGGAFFLQVYQCLGTKVFRAISALAGGAPESLSKDQGGPIAGETANGCVQCPGTPVPELIIFGQLDESQGGDFQALCQAEASGCDLHSLTSTQPTPCQTYNGCPPDKSLEYCNIPGLGHQGWSEANTTSWGFFKTYL